MSVSSQDDTGSLNSRSSSLDFTSSPLENKERLVHIDSAIKWIKEELAGMRDRDKSILQHLSHVQSCILTIKQQQQHSLKVQNNVERRHIMGSTEDLNKTQETMVNHSNDKYGTLAANISSPSTITSSGGTLCTSPTMLTPITLNANDEALSTLLSKDDSSVTTVRMNIPFSSKSVFSFENCEDSVSAEESKDLLNLTDREKRRSAVSEIQRLRKQLQEEMKQDLKDFDQEFDTPKLLEITEDKKSYRHSILHRMDELLNHTPDKGPGRNSGHVRQSSEPVMTGSVSEWALSSHKRGSHPKPDFHSFRQVSKPMGMTRSGSAGFPKNGSKARGGTHYDTTVVGRRRGSRPNSRNSTLENQKNHPLHYSIDSLSEHSDASSTCSDHESPEHKVVMSNGHHKHTAPPPLTDVPRHPSSSDCNPTTSSPEIHPAELSPLSPLLNHMDTYMMTSQAFEEYMSKGKVRVEQPGGSRSAPLSRKNGLTQNDTWL